MNIDKPMNIEEQMKRNEAAAYSVLNHTPEGIAWLDEQLNVIYFNEAAKALFRYSQAEALTLTLSDLVPPQTHLINAMFVGCFHRSSPAFVETPSIRQAVFCQRKNGSEFSMVVSAVRVMVEEGVIFTLSLHPSTGKSSTETDLQAQALRQAPQAMLDAIYDYRFIFDQSGQVLKVNKQAIDWLGYEDRFYQMFTRNRSMMFLLSPETGDILDANLAACQFYGYSLPELCHMNINRIHQPDEHASAQTPADLREQRDHSVLQHRLANGEIRTVEVHSTPIVYQDQKILFSIVHDISERTRMENELKASQEKLNFRSRFEDLLTRISTRFINLSSLEVDAAITTALQEIGRFENVDRSYVFLVDNALKTMSNTHEWCREDIEPQIQILQDLPFETLPWWVAKIQKREVIAVPDVNALPLEARTEKDLLQVQGIQSVIVLPCFANTELLGFVGLDAVSEPRDWDQEHVALLQQFGNIISSSLKRKWAESALLQSEARYKAVLDAIPDSMFRISAAGVIRDYFSSDSESLALPVEKIPGAVLTNFLPPDVARHALEKISAAIQSSQKQTLEYQLTIDGRPHHFEARFVASGQDEVVAIVRNVSERARLEQMKSDFINRAVHDLRTPLTTIILMVRLLEGECTPEEHEEYWNVLKDEVERERILIQDLLTVGQLESNRWKVKAIPVDPLSPLNSSVQSILPQASEKRIRINVARPVGDFEIMADVVSLQQVFTNLLNNAVKFTPPEGLIEVACTAQEKAISIRIHDSGVGIPPEDLPMLFGRFYRGRNAIEQEIPGSGLGLYIVKSIVEHFGGQIEVESQPGQGAAFTLEFPLIV